MVNNNQIPIEVNKKPFETVCEINNEIPSHEEFMKTYETDGSLNYDDLSGGDVGESKGYGPCSSSKCTCYTRLGYVPLNTGCPVCSGSTPHQWVHSYNNCGRPIYISRSVYLKCMSCGTDGHWKTWSFKCERHQALPAANTSSNVFMTALNLASSMNADDYESIDIIDEIVSNLIKERKNERRR